MDDYYKLEIMEKYNFSGFGSKLTVIKASVNISAIENPYSKADEEIIDMINRAYNSIQENYDSIDFSELENNGIDRNDEYLGVLFLVDEKLHELKTSISDYVEYLKDANYEISEDNQIYRNVVKVIDEIDNIITTSEFNSKKSELEKICA